MREKIKKITPDFLIIVYRKYKKHKLYKKIKGDNVYCPICRSSFKFFLSYGFEGQEMMCHKCESLERHRLVWKYLCEKTNLYNETSKKRLLHFAPELFFYNIFSENKNIEYIPCDSNPEEYNYDGNILIQKVDITNIPFNENQFDVILCIHVLEHIPDDRLAMKELYRVIKKGGWGIFQVPVAYNIDVTMEDTNITSPKEREWAFGAKDHVRWYGKDYKDRLRSVGFSVTEDDYAKRLPSEDISRFGLCSSEMIYFCRK